MVNKILSGRQKHFVLAAFFLVPVMVAGLLGAVYSANPAEEQRVDMLTIDLPKPDGTQKMPAVSFRHDQHTSALADKGCKACHRQKSADEKPARFDFAFKNTDKIGPEAAMKQFHGECAGCHRKMRDNGQTSGPLTGECRACHQRQSGISSNRQAIEFSKSLHYRHTESNKIVFKPDTNDKNCGACHHVYNEELEKTVYKKGEEGSCRYCHKQTRVDDTRSYRMAAHTDCVNCHKRLSDVDKDAGPVDCAGCHSKTAQAEIEKIEEVPRMKRDQPDAVLMADWMEEAVENGELPDQRMAPVAFDHKTHESATETCRACHHASLEPCRKCHTSKGDKQGDYVALGGAMHAGDSAKSCVGCHDAAKQHKNCAGCHRQMTKNAFADRNCRQCHDIDEGRLKPLPKKPEQQAKIAEFAIEKRPETLNRVADEKIPEKVTIDIMADQYKGATFPHRKIVKALAEKTGESELAKAFHNAQKETLCMGCHHNSPASLTPPRCASCHQFKRESPADSRPALKGAYHGQCIGCHDQMQIKKPAATDCTACHKKQKED